MANFMTRVELHSASGSDYEKLHNEMANRGFSRQILGSDGKTYQLPTAEYVSTSNESCQQVRDRAKAAAEATGKLYGIITVEYTSAAWILSMS